MLAARLALDAGDDRKLREKYAMEIAETTAENENKKFILDFARRILRLDDPEISESVKGVYRVQTLPLEEYRKYIKLQNARLEGREEGREEGIEEGLKKAASSMLARGTPLQEVAETLELPVDMLQQLKPH